MNRIMMIGIDHNEASIDERERFSFTKNQAHQALAKLRNQETVSGCLLLSTCNRTELWISGNKKTNMRELMESISKESSPHLVERSGEEAVNHLFRLSCGLESQLTGEDQILTQVRDALTLAQSCGCGDRVLDKTFRGAISAAKKVKTQVALSAINPSAAKSSVALMEDQLGNLADIPCLIIGNGQIGRLLAEDLVRRKADVTMTLRKRIHGEEIQESILPEGCHMIPYEERMENLGKYRCVISATLSPHFTVKAEEMKKPNGEQLFLDLAVPRDIETKVGDFPGITLYNIDQISHVHRSDGEDKDREQAEAILTEAVTELGSRLAFEATLPIVEHISELLREDVKGRMKNQTPEDAAEKSFRKLLFGLRKHLPEHQWAACFSALEKAAMDDTIKTGERRQYEEG